jgi:hypothetical protein
MPIHPLSANSANPEGRISQFWILTVCDPPFQSGSTYSPVHGICSPASLVAVLRMSLAYIPVSTAAGI